MRNAPSPVVDTVPVRAADGSIVYIATDEPLPDDIRNLIRIRAEAMETWREVLQRCAEWAIAYPKEARWVGEFTLQTISFAGIVAGIVFLAYEATKKTH